MIWSPELREEVINTEYGAPLKAFCEKHNLNYASASARKREFRHEKELGIKKITKVKAPTEPKNNTTIYYESEIKALNNEINTLKKEIGFQKVIKEVAERKVIALPRVNPPKPVKREKKTVNEIGVLLFSDAHIGERVDKDDMGGLNEYNFNIFSLRMERLASGILSIKNKMQGYSIEHLEVIALGDMIGNSNIHEELASTSEETVIESIFKGALVTSQFLLDLLTEFKTIHFTGLVGNHGRCFDRATQLLTIDGYKNYDELSVGDLVATLNLNSSELEWQAIEDITINKDEPVMCVSNTKSSHIAVTPDHTMITLNKRGYKKSFAKDLWCKKKIYAIPTTAKSGCPDYPVSDDLIKFMAWVITDGSVVKKGTYFSYKIYQSKEYNIEEIKALLERLGVTYSEYIRDRDIEEICGKKLKSCKSEHCFSIHKAESECLYQKTKLDSKYKFPAWMLQLSDRQVKLFLDECIKGNGTLSTERMGKNGYICRPSMTLWGRKDQLDEFQKLLITHNISCSITEQNTRRGTYYLQVRSQNNVNLNPENKYINEAYNDVSWCVSVKNATLLLRKDGKPFIAGNTTKQVTYKNRYVNWDYVFYQVLALMMRNNPRITFDIPKSFWTIKGIGGLNFLALHGDNIKGWNGIPWYGIQRAVYKLTELLGSNNKQFDICCLGHFHNAGVVSRTKGEIMLNSSIIGGNEYSVGGLFASTEPSQTFFGVNPKHRRVTWKFNINLDLIDETTGRYRS